MKTKHTNKFIVLILSVMMIAALFVGMSVTASAATNSGLKPGDTFYFTPDVMNISRTQEVKVVFMDASENEIIDPNSDDANYPYHGMTKGDGDIWSLKIPEGAHTIYCIYLFDENGESIYRYNVKADLSNAAGIYLKYITTMNYEWLTTTYTAPNAGSAKIYGANVNLGGDIEMKYHVDLGDNVTINQVKLRTVFLGVEKFLTTTETYTTEDGRTLYVFTLEGITPQCMGDGIDAVLYVDNKDVDSLLDYSVKQNIVNIYNDSDDEALKQLIIDTLEYGAAAQVYRNYKTSALVTADFADASTDIDVFVPENNPVLEDKSNDVSVSANVRYSSINYLLFGLTGASDYEGKVTLNDVAATGKMQDGYYTVATGAISPVDFLKDFTMKYENGAEDYVTLTYSVNDYCYAAYTKGESDAMKELALALYNYGLSAHNYKGHEGGNATCSQRAVCTVCGLEYGDLLPHNYTYTKDQASATITESCDQGCGHEVSVKLEAPQDAVYNGNEHPATLTYTGGAALKGATPTILYDTSDGNAPVNPGNYLTFLNVVSEAGYYSVSVPYSIGKATPVVTVPTANDLTYNGTAQELVTAGTTTGGTLVYSLTGADGSFSETIPTATDVGDYSVYYYVQGDDNHDDTTYNYIQVTIKKATPDVTAPEANNLTYNGIEQELVTAGTTTGGTLVYSLTFDGDFTTTIPKGKNAGNYTVYYYAQGDGKNFNDSEKASVTVIIQKADPPYTEPTGLTANLGQTLADVALTDGWAWVDNSLPVGAEGENEFNAVFTPTDTANYNTITKALTVSVSMSAATVTMEPAAVSGLEYTGEAHALVTAGTASGGEVQYKLGADGTYSDKIPTAIDVGTYTVYWKVVGDNNHGDTDEQPITVTISANAVAEDELNVTGYDASYTYTGEAIKPQITITVDGKELTEGTDYDVTYDESPYVGEKKITITFKGNYNGTATVTFTITSAEGTDDFISDWMPVG